MVILEVDNGPHKYAYVHGDPVGNADPTGKIAISLAIGFSLSNKIRGNKAKADLSTGARILDRLTLFGTAVGFLGEVAVTYSFTVHDFIRSRERVAAKGLGGKDITPTLTNTADSLHRWWSRLDETEKQRNFDALYSGISGWDVDPLPEDKATQRSKFASNNASWAPRSVTVDDKVFYAHEVNYFYWGYIHKLAERDGLDTSKSRMNSWITWYRVLGDVTYNILRSEHGGTRYGRIEWANAGWEYAKTSNLSVPSGPQLPNATENDELYENQTFDVYIGRELVPLVR